MQGTFNAKLHMTSSYGVSFSGESGPGTLGLRFTPACAQGPCNVTLGVVGGKIQRFTLKRAAARPLKDEWRASKLEGTILVRSASQLGCVASVSTTRSPRRSTLPDRPKLTSP